MVSSLFVLASFSSVLGHMELLKPPPLRSTHNPYYNYSNYDYSMTSPLSQDGSNFPCKGYLVDLASSSIVDSLIPSQKYTVDLGGSATHGGGSCQFSLSYDGGKTFGVIHSMIGGCPMESSYQFTILSDLPAGKKVVFAWTWFNKIGNREMYMNCAVVDVAGFQTVPVSVPKMFEANVFGPGTCNTVEGTEVVFDAPGDSVEYAGSYIGQHPSGSQLKGCANQADKVIFHGSGGSSSASSSPFTWFPTSIASPSRSTTSSSIITTTSSSVHTNATNRSSTATPIAIDLPMTCSTTGEVMCYNRGYSYKICVSGSYVDIGAVPQGNQCVDGKIIAVTCTTTYISTPRTVSTSSASHRSSPAASSTFTTSAATSTPETCINGNILCGSTGETWSMCSNGVYINMGSVALGTTCVDGVIKQRRLRVT